LPLGLEKVSSGIFHRSFVRESLSRDNEIEGTMAKPDWLKNVVLLKSSTGVRSNVTLRLLAETDRFGFIDGVSTCFRMRPDITSIKVVVDDKFVGFIERKRFPGPDRAEFGGPASARSKGEGFGSGGGAQLPGKSKLKLLILQCPIKECEKEIWTFSYDEDDPPKCPDHPDEKMKVKQ